MKTIYQRLLLINLFLLLNMQAMVPAMSDSIRYRSAYLDDSYYTIYHPVEEQNLRATVLILHGMQEHGGRYKEFAQFLVSKGYAVICYDHNGHGKTAKNDDEQGFFPGDNPAQQLVDDAYKMTNYLHGLFPDVPHFLLGHSMGSFIARSLLQEHSDKFDGAVIVGTGGKIVGVKFLLSFLSIKNKMSPQQRSEFVNNTFSKQNNKKFRSEPDFDGTNWLSLSKSNRENFEEDPLNGIAFTNNGFHTLMSLNVRATKNNWSKSLSKKLPLLFVSGADDPIGDFGKGVIKTVDALKNEGFEDVSLKLYPNMRHEILNEAIRENVYEDITKWLEQHQ